MSCPSTEDLELFAIDALNDVARRRLESHLRDCPECERRLGEVRRGLELAPRLNRAVLPSATATTPTIGAATDATRLNPDDSTFLVRRTALRGAPRPADRPAELALPQQLGPVRLVREIGRGGMGAVFLGHDQLLRRDVAVKFLLEAVCGPDDPGFERFLHGARAAARVQHPGLTTIFQADLCDCGASAAARVPYLVMQYIDGPTLGTVLRKAGRLSAPAGLAALAAVGEAVAALHEADIVPRDIKPQNVLLDAAARVYVTDFGLMLDRAGGAAEAVLAGTMPYMAPEMFDGEVSPRSDVYALGIVGCELLTGELPFRGATAAEWIRLHRDEPLPVERLRAAGVDAPLIDVLARAAHKNAVFRFKSAGPFLRALLECCPSAATPRAGTADLARWVSGDETKSPAPAGPTVREGRSSYYDVIREKALEKSAARPEVAAPADQEECTEPSPPAAVATAARSLCVTCGYDLNGLPPEGRCPECGTLVARSMVDRLSTADPSWLARICSGQTLIFVACVMWLVGRVGDEAIEFVDPWGSFDPASVLWGVWDGAHYTLRTIEDLVAPIVAIFGVFALTVPEPRLSLAEARIGRRRILRFVPTALCTITLGYVLVGTLLFVSGREADVRGLSQWNPVIWDYSLYRLLNVVVLLLTLVLAGGHLRALAARVPAPALGVRITNAAFRLGACVVVAHAAPWGSYLIDLCTTHNWAEPEPDLVGRLGWVCGYAALALLAWLSFLMWRLRQEFRRCLGEARVAAASAPGTYDNSAREKAPEMGGARGEARAPGVGERRRKSARSDGASPSNRPLCVACGYDLHGLPPEGRCPECGTPVARSTLGDRLSRADPRWLARISSGQTMIFLACLIGQMGCVMALAIIFAAPWRWLDAATIAGLDIWELVLTTLSSAALAMPSLLLVGIHGVTALDPRMSLAEQPIERRRFLRLFALATLVMSAGTVVTPLLPAVAAYRWVLLSITGALLATTFLLAGSHLRLLAARIPASGLGAAVENTAARLVVFVLIACVGLVLSPSAGIGRDVGAWTDALMTFIAILGGVSLLISLVLLASFTPLMWRLRQELRRCLAEARVAAASTQAGPS